MTVEYDHSRNLHTTQGPQAALAALFATARPASLLDVGCGTGTWLKAAIEMGIADVFGIDGVALKGEQLLFPAERFLYQDLTLPWKIGRRFEAALCLEVAEHLDEKHASGLVDALVSHADTIYFSAACPGQMGQHHVNCQWPRYWQELFNSRGFACSDAVRWLIWDDARVEPWYRQNLMIASRSSATAAGQEPRIPAVIHPDMLQSLSACGDGGNLARAVTAIEQGSQPILWYATIGLVGASAKARRAIGRAIRTSHVDRH